MSGAEDQDYVQPPSDDEHNPSDPGEPSDDEEPAPPNLNAGNVCCHGVGVNGDYEGAVYPYCDRDPIQHPRLFHADDVPNAPEFNRHINRINEVEQNLARVIPVRAQILHQDHRDIRGLRERHAVRPVQANDAAGQRVRGQQLLRVVQHIGLLRHAILVELRRARAELTNARNSLYAHIDRRDTIEFRKIWSLFGQRERLGCVEVDQLVRERLQFLELRAYRAWSLTSQVLIHQADVDTATERLRIVDIEYDRLSERLANLPIMPTGINHESDEDEPNYPRARRPRYE
jgi:hypothetical protein